MDMTKLKKELNNKFRIINKTKIEKRIRIIFKEINSNDFE